MTKSQQFVGALSILLALLLLATPAMSRETAGESLSQQCERLSAAATEKLGAGFVDEASEEQNRRAHAEARGLLHQSMEVCLRASREARDPAAAAGLAGLSFVNKGKALEDEQRFADALLAYQDGADQVMGLAGDRSPALVELYERQAEMMIYQKDYDGSRRLVEQSLDLRREIHGDDHPDVIPGLMLMAVSYHPFRGESAEEKAALGRDAEKAEAYYREALGIALEGASDETLQQVLDALGMLLRAEGRDNEARSLLTLKH